MTSAMGILELYIFDSIFDIFFLILVALSCVKLRTRSVYSPSSSLEIYALVCPRVISDAQLEYQRYAYDAENDQRHQKRWRDVFQIPNPQ